MSGGGPLLTVDDFPPGRELEDRIAEVAGHISGRHRHLPFVRLCKITSHSVEEDCQIALRLEQTPPLVPPQQKPQPFGGGRPPACTPPRRRATARATPQSCP